MTARYDVVVVGGRVAGAATALQLARRGVRVLVLDRGSYRSDTVSTHAFMRTGVVQLKRWGLLDRLVSAGVPPVRTTVFHHLSRDTHITLRPAAGVDVWTPRVADAWKQAFGAITEMMLEGARATTVRCAS